MPLVVVTLATLMWMWFIYVFLARVCHEVFHTLQPYAYATPCPDVADVADGYVDGSDTDVDSDTPGGAPGAAPVIPPRSDVS